MKRNWGWTIAIVLCWALCRPQAGWCQNSGASVWQERQLGPGSVEAPSAPELVHEVQPSEYWLPDKDGNLQAVINIPYELFEQIYRRQQEPEQTIPPFAIESLQLDGKVLGQRAEIVARMEIRTSRPGWIAVPIRFAEAALLSGVASSGSDTEHFLAFEPSAGGYVLWIRNESPGLSKYEVRLLLSVKSVGSESRIELSTPRAAKAELKLSVPVAPAAASLSEGAVLAAQRADDKSAATEFLVAGQGGYLGRDGYLQMTWWRDDGHAIAPRPAVEAKGTMLVKLDGRGALAEGTISVRAFGGPIDQVRLRLPPGAEILAGEPGGYEIRTVEPDGAAGASGRLVEVRTKEPTAGPIDIRFTVAQEPAADDTPTAGWLELAGVEVVGAMRQSGFVAVTTVGDWNVLWGRQRAVQRVDPMELPENLRNAEGMVAAYRYFSRGLLLTARVIPRRTHATVQASYRIQVRGDQAVLDATFDYTVRGEPVSLLSLDMQQWQMEQLGPDAVVAVEAVDSGRSGNISVPLIHPMTGTFKLVLRARQTLDPHDSALTLRFPVPSADMLMPAQVTVEPAENVELVPELQRSVGLLRRSSGSSVPNSSWGSTVLVYQAELPAARFEARKVVRRQQVHVQVSSIADLRPGRGSVEQRLSYQVAYEPTDRLFVDVPSQLAQSGQWQVTCGGWELQPVAMPEEPVPTASAAAGGGNQGSATDTASPAIQSGDRSAAEESTVRYGLLLPEARTGDFEVVIRYRVDVPHLLPRSSILASIPLVMPSGATPVKNDLEVLVGNGVLVQPQEAAWKGVVGSSGWLASAGSAKLTSQATDARVVLALHRRDGATTIVERAWLQTWLGRFGRQDRAVFQLATQADQLEFWLPIGESLGEARVRLANQPGGPWQQLQAELTPSGTVRVWLPEALAAVESQVSGRRGEEAPGPPASSAAAQPVRWLEIQSRYLNTQLRIGRQSIELPRLLGDVWVRRAYWQVVLPANEHLLTVPAGLTPEYRWSWTGTFFGRTETMDQHDLERWVGAAQLPPPPTHATRYLFSTLEIPSAAELVVASRGVIVLVCSGVALVVGLLLLYVRVARHPVALLLLAVILGALSAVWPDQALLGGQAAGIGVGLVLLAALVRVVSNWPRRWGRAAETSSILVDRGSTEIHYRPSTPSQQTETAPLAVSGSSVGTPR